MPDTLSIFMAKDFTHWHRYKARLEDKQRLFAFSEAEMWWCSVGINVGNEEDGKNLYFERPILVIRKFNKKIFWALPLTSRDKDGLYYYKFSVHGEIKTVILSQLRIFSSKRLQRRIGKIDYETFLKIKYAAGIR